jgi:hypothetical protein
MLCIAGLEISEHSRYISPNMLYRYCREIMQFPAGVQWAIFHLQSDGSTGRQLRQVNHNMVTPGNYIILDQSQYNTPQRTAKVAE